MSLQLSLRATIRVVFGLALFAATVPLTSGDAEARGKGGISAADAAPAVRTINRSSEEKPTETAPENAEDATAPAESVPAAPARAQAVVKTKPAVVSKPKDADVPGCSPGMICTVCVAGCNGAVNSIIHSVPKKN